MSERTPHRAINVHLVTNNTSKVTRKDILEWIGSACNIELKRVEDLANGSVYCRVMDKIFPGSVQLNRVKTNTKFESEAISNYKLLLQAFQKYEVKKDIPMNGLLKGRFLDNFRFAQWFKLFYEANTSSRVGLKHQTSGYACDPQRMREPQHPKRSKSVTGREVTFDSPKSPGLDGPPNRRPPSGPSTIGYHNRSTARIDGTVDHQGHQTTTVKRISDLKRAGGSYAESCKPLEHEEEPYVEPSDPSDAEIYEFPSPVKKDALLASDSANDLSEPHNSVYQEPTRNVECPKSDSPDDDNLGTLDLHENRRTVRSPDLGAKRRGGSGRQHGLPGVQLPPPSPSLGTAQTQHRSNRRASTVTSWNQTHRHATLSAAGDRPAMCATNQNVTSGESQVSGHTSASNHSGQRSAPDGAYHNHGADLEAPTHRSQCCSTGSKRGNNDASTRKVVSNPTTDNTSGANMRSPKQSSPSRAIKAISKRDAQNCEASRSVDRQPFSEQTPLEVMNHPSNSTAFTNPETMTESMLHELAMLRFETMGQRRSLFYCQKEAQFYFKKLRQIEDLCLQLNEMREKPINGILEAIFGILYETEEGFASPGEADACV